MAGKTKYQNWLTFNVSSNGAKINEVIFNPHGQQKRGFQFTAAIEKKKKNMKNGTSFGFVLPLSHATVEFPNAGYCSMLLPNATVACYSSILL